MESRFQITRLEDRAAPLCIFIPFFKVDQAHILCRETRNGCICLSILPQSVPLGTQICLERFTTC